MSCSIQSLLKEYPSLDLLDKSIWLAHCLSCDRSYLLAYPERIVDAATALSYREGCQRRAKGEPLAYITGQAGFLGEMFQVDHRVLVPRPETESLVLYLLEMFDESPIACVDVGTGSGVIAISLKQARPLWHVSAIDSEADALVVAQSNAARLVDGAIDFYHQSGLGSLSGMACVVSNPPYIAASDHHLQGDGVRFEPRSALVAEDQGIRVLQDIAEQSMRALKSGGVLVMEHGETQRVDQLLQGFGYDSIEVHQDLMGKNRFTSGVKPS